MGCDLCLNLWYDLKRLLWQDELNPRVRCAFGNVCIPPNAAAAMSWDCLSIIWWLIHKAAVVGQNIDQLPGSSKYSILINYPDPPEPQEWGLMSSRKTEEVVDREIVSSYCLLSLLWIELSFGEFSTFVFCQERGGRLAKWGPEGAFRGHQHHFQFSTNSKGHQPAPAAKVGAPGPK